ncbi:MAG: hypothetical protein QOI11_2416, partial [Candidatus Eremiobacteraeota bacterium]|nr:hypothetical protein [Candidatus Eremiobacteraeota bacterium]
YVPGAAACGELEGEPDAVATSLGVRPRETSGATEALRLPAQPATLAATSSTASRD